MKCPASIIGRTVMKGSTGEYIGDCLKEECAWWDEGEEHCVALSIGWNLSLICIPLRDIRDDMPPHIPKH